MMSRANQELRYNFSAKRENQNSVHSQFIFNKLNSHYTVRSAQDSISPYPAVVSANLLMSLSGHQRINKTQEAE